MTAITLESDSSHSPPVMYQSNARSSKKSLKSAAIPQKRAIICEDSRSERRIIPRSTLTTRKGTLMDRISHRDRIPSSDFYVWVLAQVTDSEMAVAALQAEVQRREY